MNSEKKLLIVEDSLLNRQMLREILSARYHVLEAENGQAALALLEEHKEEIVLILLDIIMPVMDGYTFLSIIKSNPLYAHIPVIVITGCGAEKDEINALSHGAADFVAKPFNPQIILHRIANILNLQETAMMVSQFKYDRLTGLYTKGFFTKKVREVLHDNPDKAYDIICSDIEKFKLFNDLFGTQAGDRLLCSVAEQCSIFAGIHGIAGRIQADRFVCLKEHENRYTAEMFAQAGAMLNSLSGTKSVSIKWGIYTIEDRNVEVEKMYDRALLAAHSIKGQYGKYFAVYDDKLRSRLVREQTIVESMESALENREFVVYLQPKYRVRDYQLAGAEALVRWEHPEWGILSPGVFIPLFEKNGFIIKLDQYVWEETCRILQMWRNQGLPLVPVSVNVSRADIYQEDIADILLKLVSKYGLPPSLLHLEITESAYTENQTQIIDTVKELRKRGFVIEMDDFGSGYSSLNMLNRMPLDILKLDLKFIQSETAKPVDKGILHFIMNLARWMDLLVTAEGVETEEQLMRLQELGCDFVQGYYFAKPMKPVEFRELLCDAKICVPVRKSAEIEKE